jgi:hypothetical protein
VVDANGQPLGYFYGRDDDTDRKVYPLSRDEARRMTVNFARLPELLALEKSERIFDGDHVRTHLSLPHVLRVLDLHPTQTPAGLVAAVDALRDDAFEPHGAGVAEHRLATSAKNTPAAVAMSHDKSQWRGK